MIQDLIGYLILLQIAVDRRDAASITESAGTITLIDDCGWDPTSGPTC